MFWDEECFMIFFSVRLLSVLGGHSFFSSPPQLTVFLDDDKEGKLERMCTGKSVSVLNWLEVSSNIANSPELLHEKLAI